MPPLNWDIFNSLPDASDANFEQLCRTLIRRHYGQYGQFAALNNQPGVEFHLKLDASCALGVPGRWYGWQCKWYDIRNGRAIGNARRKKIEAAIRTTEKVLPDLNDWVLWTRHPLTEGDQQWFNSIATAMKLHLWTAAEVEEHLTGNAAIFRATYFGELVLTPESLAELHARAVAPIRLRWQPEIHQTVDAERAIRRMLGESDSWDRVREWSRQLESDANRVLNDNRDLPGAIGAVVAVIENIARSWASALMSVHVGLDKGDLDLLREQLSALPPTLDSDQKGLSRKLRARRHPAALGITNAIADISIAHHLLDSIERDLNTGIAAILAEAGCGKTQLSGELTAAASRRPAGILLHGRDLTAGTGLDDFAGKVVVQGQPVASFEALVAAVDAAGHRARRRLPIIIDGLNEAEDPRIWKGALATADELLRKYPYVLLICTLRPAFENESLPANLETVQIGDFGNDTRDAVRKYFAHYKIDAADAELPHFLRHPLTLRLFCEVTNLERREIVSIEAAPESLTALFDEYLQQAASRIADLSPLTQRYYELDVTTALSRLGAWLWDKNTRGIELKALRILLNDEHRPWDKSIVRALEQEGVLLRFPENESASGQLAVAFDLLSGHIIAGELLTRVGHNGLEQWLRSPAIQTALNGPFEQRHPLADDVFRALIGLAVRRLRHSQIWTMLDEPLRSLALRHAAALEGAFLDAQTVEELKAIAVPEPSVGNRSLLGRLLQTRGLSNHPLNARFLDDVLRPLAVADRDFRWTEWLRRNQDVVIKDLEWLDSRWRTRRFAVSGDGLRARWVMWTLTSTVRSLRDLATRALYYFGRVHPAALFDLTIQSLSINDTYVCERMLGASYGVVMAHAIHDAQFAVHLTTYLTQLRDSLTGQDATNPTNHWLARLYVQGTVDFASKYYPSCVPEGLQANTRVPFATAPLVAPIVKGHEVDLAIHMDFENYTVGRLCEGRHNYDMNHPGHISALASIRGSIAALGWKKVTLGASDDEIASHFGRTQPSTERYGKKYSWIGFYNYAGTLVDSGQLESAERLSDVNIDPSFPETPPPAQITVPTWIRAKPEDDEKWIRKGVVAIPDELLYRHEVNGHKGPWIAVQGFLEIRQEALGRKVFGFLRGLLVTRKEVDKLIEALNAKDYPGNHWLPEVPQDFYTFAGEIPWSQQFGRYDSQNAYPIYTGSVQGAGETVEVEILSHAYTWESYHSELNQAGGTLVPSRSYSAKFDLRPTAQSFNQTTADGSVASVSLSGPEGSEGDLLYLREDFVRQYAGQRRFVWFVWGERELNLRHAGHFPEWPEWYTDAARQNAHLWRFVRKADDLCPSFAPKTSSKRPRRKKK